MINPAITPNPPDVERPAPSGKRSPIVPHAHAGGDAYALLRDARKRASTAETSLHDERNAHQKKIAKIVVLSEEVAELHHQIDHANTKSLRWQVERDSARAMSALWKRSAKADQKALRNLESQADELRVFLNSKGIYEVSLLAGLQALADRAYRAQESATAAGVIPKDESPIMSLLKAQRERDTAIRERDALQAQIDTLQAELSALAPSEPKTA